MTALQLAQRDLIWAETDTIRIAHGGSEHAIDTVARLDDSDSAYVRAIAADDATVYFIAANPSYYATQDQILAAPRPR